MRHLLFACYRAKACVVLYNVLEKQNKKKFKKGCSIPVVSAVLLILQWVEANLSDTAVALFRLRAYSVTVSSYGTVGV